VRKQAAVEEGEQPRPAGVEAAKQAAKPLNLAMGEPNRCFYNATRAVGEHPDRLVYVEGFYVNEYHITHHASVLDKLTGARHELSFRERPHDVFIGKESTKYEMIDLDEGLFDGLENWKNAARQLAPDFFSAV
jgi:hypothetical protein